MHNEKGGASPLKFRDGCPLSLDWCDQKGHPWTSLYRCERFTKHLKNKIEIIINPIDEETAQIWCLENVEGRWSTDMQFDSELHVLIAMIFEDQNDAVLFKLTFANNIIE